MVDVETRFADRAVRSRRCVVAHFAGRALVEVVAAPCALADFAVRLAHSCLKVPVWLA